MKFIKVNSSLLKKIFSNPKFIALAKRQIKLNFEYHIPYLCGYAKNGKTVYFDKHLKRYMKYQGRIIDTVDFLLVHEYVEWILIEHFRINYMIAHHIATHAESLAVRQHGINWWVYTKFMKPQIKTAYHSSIKKLPPDLDLRPYEDEHERKTLEAVLSGKAGVTLSARERFNIRKNNVSLKRVSLNRHKRNSIDIKEENDYNDHNRIIHYGKLSSLH